MSSLYQDLPPTFRSGIVGPIMHHIAAGDSGSIVGIGSVGKSNLLRFLQRQDVRREHLGEAWANYLFVYVDINKILKQSRWGLLELMLHQLLTELTNRGTEEVVLKPIDDLHQRATQTETSFLALRYLDRAIGIVCNQLKLKLVFLIDEFDELCRTMSARGFSALRALRDEYKYRLMYVVATRLELKRLRDDASEIEAFEELVVPHTTWLGPYDEEDAEFMVDRLGSRYTQPLDGTMKFEVFRATGGHPGLIRDGYSVARENGSGFFDILKDSPRVQNECQRLWFSLPADEQKVLISLANHNTIPADQASIVKRLQRKGLVGGPWTEPDTIFSSLFANYLKKQPDAVKTHIVIDYNRHHVWVDGRKVSPLTPLEYKLICYLDERRGQICSRDDLANHLYPDDMVFDGKGVADNRLDSVVKRLRKRIEPDPKNPRYIVTVRGHGFRLDDKVEA
ncbi:MAG: winged helix-turn-helix transcriptional regulator [Anaerolineae bacterium]|nr:winged helix-turn-helix transcriptional regulator [Anaerolineae bacterium]